MGVDYGNSYGWKKHSPQNVTKKIKIRNLELSKALVPAVIHACSVNVQLFSLCDNEALNDSVCLYPLFDLLGSVVLCRENISVYHEFILGGFVVFVFLVGLSLSHLEGALKYWSSVELISLSCNLLRLPLFYIYSTCQV